jgi:hypothetical protein
MISSPAFMQYSQDAFFIGNMQPVIFILFVLLIIYGIFFLANHILNTQSNKISPNLILSKHQKE